MTLTPQDTYAVLFVKCRGIKNTVIAERDDAYAEDLRRVFTEVTGLDTSL